MSIERKSAGPPAGKAEEVILPFRASPNPENRDPKRELSRAVKIEVKQALKARAAAASRIIARLPPGKRIFVAFLELFLRFPD